MPAISNRDEWKQSEIKEITAQVPRDTVAEETNLGQMKPPIQVEERISQVALARSLRPLCHTIGVDPISQCEEISQIFDFSNFTISPTIFFPFQNFAK